MIKINLLPHREEKRKQLKKDFYSLLALAAVIGALIVIAVGAYYAAQVSAQNDRNNFIKAENAKLDEKIKEVATLKQEIDGLKARQQAVEDLQGDRNQPVYLLNELVKLTPEGVYVRSLKQDGQRVILNGYAQSNERVSEFLRNLGNKSLWMYKPDVEVIKSAGIGQGRDAKKVFDFTINVGIKRPRELEAASASTVVAAPAVKKP
ncbi:PilN domain-containing protein [Undibacterium sp.]|jgi:type IV pilus assembly protein PilN|uniref:PilN domain-containing protein n=1 Tax=Undibacterium sp. TaxID=1914977 RepID=UPI002B944795|nr:PilN domain-containing protein [Undibacterium sp.]HTD03201.1 PilN domain-containing protein [Undibacterium sp.]